MAEPLPESQHPYTPPAPVSPRWNALTKFLVALVVVFLAGSLVVRFQEMVGPVVFALVLAHVLTPLVERLSRITGWPWPATVNIVFLALVILIAVLLTVAGIAIEQQAVGLYGAVRQIVTDLPARLDDYLHAPLAIGPFTFDLSQPLSLGPFTIDLSTADLRPLYDQVIGALQPALSQTGTFVGSLASGTANFLGWVIFILVLAYYMLHDVKELLPSLERLVPAGYAGDARRLLFELGPIWNAFLRGQFILAVVMGLVVGLTMAVLGVRYAVVLGLLAGLLEFVPIVGPVIAGTVAVLIALFQASNWLGLPPVYFALVVLAASVLLQQLENNLLVPRILGGSLDLHPVAILVGAVIAASLAGIIGLLLSAPAMATLRLFGRYVYRKMFDLNPWPEPMREPESPPPVKWPRWLLFLRRKLKLPSRPAGGGAGSQ